MGLILMSRSSTSSKDTMSSHSNYAERGSGFGVVKGILISDTRSPDKPRGALLVEQDGTQVWIPESVCIQISTRPGPPTMVEMKVEMWFLEKNEIDYE